MCVNIMGHHKFIIITWNISDFWSIGSPETNDREITIEELMLLATKCISNWGFPIVVTFSGFDVLKFWIYHK